MRRDVFQAIADPTRRAIVELLAEQSLTLNGVADNFTISRPAISRHIRILAECGLVKIRPHGRERYCEVQLNKLDEVADWLEPYRQFWEESFDRLDDVLQEAQKKENPSNDTKE